MAFPAAEIEGNRRRKGVAVRGGEKEEKGGTTESGMTAGRREWWREGVVGRKVGRLV